MVDFFIAKRELWILSYLLLTESLYSTQLIARIHSTSTWSSKILSIHSCHLKVCMLISLYFEIVIVTYSFMIAHFCMLTCVFLFVDCSASPCLSHICLQILKLKFESAPFDVLPKNFIFLYNFLNLEVPIKYLLENLITYC